MALNVLPTRRLEQHRRGSRSLSASSAQFHGLPAIDGDPFSPTGGSLRRPLGASASESSLGGSMVNSGLQQEARERIALFSQRNHPTASKTFGSRQRLSTLQREMVRDTRAEDDAGFLGTKGAKGFKAHLQLKYGSLVAGWRALDTDGNVRLSHGEFLTACRKIGFHGNLKHLWKELHANGSGTISLKELDSEVGHYVETFKTALVAKYGDIATAWHEGLDMNQSGRIEQGEFDACVQDLGLDLNPKKLYSILKPASAQDMSLADFDPEAWNRWHGGQLKGALSRADREFYDDHDFSNEELADDAAATTLQQGGGLHMWRQQLSAEQQAQLRERKEKDVKLELGLHSLAGFRQALAVRCGSLHGAWREFLDPDGNGRVAFGEFSQALQRLGLHGKVKQLWSALDSQKKGHIVFSDLDPKTDRQLKELKGKLIEQHGNILLGWLRGLDTKGLGRVTEPRFLEACEQLGFSGDAAQFFRVLQPDIHRNFLTLQDFDTKGYQALNRGDFRMITEPDEAAASGGRKPRELSFAERQHGCFKYQLQRALQVAQQAEFRQACRANREPDCANTTAEGFEKLCERTYGSLVGAWRLCLDIDGNGKLTFNEWCRALRQLGYAGDYRALFKKYDSGPKPKGYILLKDLDPKSHDLISCFLELLAERYGDLDSSWRQGFNRDPHECIDEVGLREACETLGYPHSADQLFRCLQPIPGRQLLSIWDLDPECTRQRQRGATALISQARSPEVRAGPQCRHSGQQADAGPEPATSVEPLLQQLRASLRLKFGSTAAAWRTALDPDGTGAACFGKLSLIMDECAFHGNRKAIWKALQKQREVSGPSVGGAFIVFADLDPVGQSVLATARQQFLGVFGCLEKAWQRALATLDSERLDKEQFAEVWPQLGLDLRQPQKVFGLLKERIFQRCLTQQDFRALLLGLTRTDWDVVWAGNSQANLHHPEHESTMVPESPQTPKSPSNYNLHGPAFEVSRTHQEFHKQDRCTDALDQFKVMLRHKYGSLFSAWCHLLDVDRNGVVTLRDFAAACRKLGVRATQRVWMELDLRGTGQVSLGDLDKATSDGFNALESQLIKRYGSTKAGWRALFDVGKSVACDQKRFQAACEKLELQQNAARLFRLLHPEPGRHCLTYEDLWVDKESKGEGR